MRAPAATAAPAPATIGRCASSCCPTCISKPSRTCGWTPAPGAELLVLAGDVGSYQPGSQLPGDDFGLERFAPARGWPVPVLFVPGNHEYDNLDFDATHARLRATCERLGITWLERETLVLGGVRFVGTTLWTDFDALAVAGARHDAGCIKQRAQGLPRRQLLPAARRAPPAAARRCWPSNGANSGSNARRGCARRWRSRSTARRWSSRTSRPACAAPTRATG